MPEQQITGFPVKAAPNSRTTKDSENFELLAVNATFDGAGASAAFLPAVEIVSDSGAVVARHVAGETVAAGGSAEVTFAPFLRGAQKVIAPSFGATLQIGTSPSGDILFTSADFIGSVHTVANGFASFQIVGTWTVTANAPLIVSVSNYGAEADFAIGACNVQTIGATTRELLLGGVVLIPTDFTSLLKLDTHVVGSTIMDLTTPTVPKFVNAGTYAVTVTLNWL